MTITIEPLADHGGVRIEDRVEQRQCRITTADQVEPVAAAPEQFPYPLDAVVEISTSQLTVANVPTGYIRGATGELVQEIEHFSEVQLPAGEYLFEVSAPIKLYLRIDGPVTVSVDAIQMTLTVGTERPVGIGVRSYHERPATTIATTSDPTDVMTAVSYLSSSLKTTNAERSYPTLRGHPPELALGDELDVPSMLSRPETGLTIEVPPELGSVFVVAPLAYYLGAEVRPGSSPRLVTDDGFVHVLDGDRGFEGEVERVLKQTVFLDCLVRTEGIYVVPLHERDICSQRLDLDYEALYELAPASQLAEYLTVPYETVVDLLPRWELTAHVTPRAESIEVLPFLVDDLAVVRTPRQQPTETENAATTAIDEFVRDNTVRGNPWGDPAAWQFVEPEQTDSIEQAWVGDDVPIGASKTVVEAFRNRLKREEKEGNIDIVVVCNDGEMLDEHHTAREVYGSRDELPFEVTVYDDLTADRLQFVLESDIDFFHYIGHIDAEGFRCSDGRLDARDVGDIGVDTFFLNACRSYEQGMELIRAGAIGGVVTLDEVINSGAIRVGKAMSRLLNRGFPLRAALTVASNRSVVGPQYIVVGDGNMDIAHTDGVLANLVEVSRRESEYHVQQHFYYSGQSGVGALVRPEIADNERHFIAGSPLVQFDVTAEALRDFLELEVVPLKIDGQLFWSDQFDTDDL